MIPLNNIPVIGTALGFIQSKARLVIEYVMIGLIVATAAVTFTLWLQKGAVEKELTATHASLTETQLRLTQVEQINQEQQKNITMLKEEHVKDSKAVVALMGQIAAITKENENAKDAIAELKARNADVAKYMSTDIPADLRGLLGDDE